MAVQMLREDQVSSAPPPKLYLLMEGRAALEYGHLLHARKQPKQMPLCAGHPVNSVPAFVARAHPQKTPGDPLQRGSCLRCLRASSR